MQFETIIIMVLLAAVIALLVVVLRKLNGSSAQESRVVDELDRAKRDIKEDAAKTAQMLSQNQGRAMQTLRETLNENLERMEKRLSNNAVENEQKLEAIRNSMDRSLKTLREENSKKLDEMRATVDEKLQKTLEERIGKSFQLVSERLEQVYKGLGEMQTLATGVGDLKKILSNVKTRGVFGEVQLGAILEQILSSEQYEENVAVKKNSPERVEFAIKLPGNEDGAVYLPIDAKFPADGYAAVVDAYDTGSKEEIERALAQLKRTLRTFAKTIHDKYIEPPYTTDFAILFLPFEGLYAEVVRAGMVDQLQRDYKVTIAGPTTMAALLNSFQMGFRTLQIQKYSSEVWEVLGAVRTEFDKFGNILKGVRNRLRQADDDLNRLVGTRTNVIQRRLKNIERLPEQQSQAILGLEDITEELETLEETDVPEEYSEE